MDLKDQFRNIVEQIKTSIRRENGKPLRNEDIAARLGYERSYFSSLLGTRGEVTVDHIKLIQLEFSEDFKGVGKNNEAGTSAKGGGDDYTRKLEGMLKENQEQI